MYIPYVVNSVNNDGNNDVVLLMNLIQFQNYAF